MFLTRRADLEPNGERPVLLYGYGGFDIAITPSFSVLHAGWLDRAAACLPWPTCAAAASTAGRGTTRAGSRSSRTCSTTSARARAGLKPLAGPRRAGSRSCGGSNGGLLVGACLTQHPELFGACVPSVGVMDMLRFHRFTVGRAWIADFGDPDEPDQFTWLRAYSPLHNLRRGAAVSGDTGADRRSRRPGRARALVQVRRGAAGRSVRRRARC